MFSPSRRNFSTETVDSEPQEDDKWIETHSGLRYRDTIVGDGSKPIPGEFVAIRYRGTLEDGSVFEDTLESGRLTHYRHDRGFVVWGMDEGLGSMRVGGERLLQIPPHLGYGFKAVGSIPPDSELRFQVRLVASGEDAEPQPTGLLASLRGMLGL
jgi:peptidylprolyl isomerase